jgi:hypothetical protein
LIFFEFAKIVSTPNSLRILLSMHGMAWLASSFIRRVMLCRIARALIWRTFVNSILIRHNFIHLFLVRSFLYARASCLAVLYISTHTLCTTLAYLSSIYSRLVIDGETVDYE